MPDSVPSSLLRGGAPGSRARLVLAALLVAIGLSATLRATLLPPLVRSDLAQSLSVARNLAAGQGLTTSLLSFEEQLAFGTAPAPQTVFPPGHAIAIAAVSAAGIEGAHAAKLLGFAGLLVAALALYAMLVHRFGRTAALAGAGAWLCVTAARANAVLGLTEMPFIALTLLATLSVPDSRAPPRPARAALFGLLAAGAFWVRYAGMFFLASIPAAFVLRGRRADRDRWIAGVVGLGVAAFGAAGLVVRNALVTRGAGPLLGTETGLVSESGTLAHVVWVADWALLLAGFSGAAARAGDPLTIAGAALCLAGAGAAMAGLDIRAGFASIARALAESMRWRLVAAYAALGVLAVALLLATTGFRHVAGARLLLPYVAPVVALAIAFLHGAVRGPRSRTTPALGALALLAAGLVSLQFAADRRLHVASAEADSVAEIARLLDEANRASSGELLPALRASPAIGCPPTEIAATLHSTVIGIPYGKYATVVWSDETVLATVRRFGVRHVVVARSSRRSTPFPSRFCGDLSDGRIPAWLEPVFEHGGALRVFAVRPSVESPSPGR